MHLQCMVFIQPALLKSFLQYRVSYRFKNLRNTQSQSGLVSSSNHCSLQVPLHDAGVTSSSGDEEFTFVRAVVEETSACHLSRVPSYFMIWGLIEGKNRNSKLNINFIFSSFFQVAMHQNIWGFYISAVVDMLSHWRHIVMFKMLACNYCRFSTTPVSECIIHRMKEWMHYWSKSFGEGIYESVMDHAFHYQQTRRKINDRSV